MLVILDMFVRPIAYLSDRLSDHESKELSCIGCIYVVGVTKNVRSFCVWSDIMEDQ